MRRFFHCGASTCVLFSLLAIASCKPRQIADTALKGDVPYDPNKPVPSRVMFHYGEHRNVSANGQNDQFSAEVWGLITKNYIPHRKGLYVAVHPAYNERYVNYVADANAETAPWLMGVVVKPECLAEGRVASRMWKLEEDARFSNMPSDKVDYFKSNCSMDMVSKRNYGEFNDRFGEDTQCSKIIYEFLEQNNIKVAQDIFWPQENYWIIRDPSCIDDMQSSPSEVLGFMATQEYWNLAPFTTNWSRHTCNTSSMTRCKTRKPAVHGFYILMRALYETDSWPEATLQAIKTEGAKSDIAYEVSGKRIGLAEMMNKIMDKAIGCAAEGKIDEFKKQLKFYLDKAHGEMEEKVYIHNYKFYAYGLKKMACGPEQQVQQVAAAEEEVAPQQQRQKYWYRLEFERCQRQFDMTGLRLNLITLRLDAMNSDRTVSCKARETMSEMHRFYCNLETREDLTWLQAKYREFDDNTGVFTQATKPSWW